MTYTFSSTILKLKLAVPVIDLPQREAETKAMFTYDDYDAWVWDWARGDPSHERIVEDIEAEYSDAMAFTKDHSGKIGVMCNFVERGANVEMVGGMSCALRYEVAITFTLNNLDDALMFKLTYGGTEIEHLDK